jgi:hypothetical protein
MVDTDCEVEIGEAEEAGVVSLSSTSPVASGQVTLGLPLYFSIQLPHPRRNIAVSLTVTSPGAQADVYLHSAVTRPSLLDWQWRSVDYSSTKCVTIPCCDVHLESCRALHGVVLQYGGDDLQTTDVRISVAFPGDVDAIQQEDTPATASGPAPDGATVCPNCRVPVAAANLDRHVAFCTRNNWRCESCNKVVKISEKSSHVHCTECPAVVSEVALDKHMATMHRPISCDCGALIEPMYVPLHREYECEMRPVPCQFCDAAFPERALPAHKVGARPHPATSLLPDLFLCSC